MQRRQEEQLGIFSYEGRFGELSRKIRDGGRLPVLNGEEREPGGACKEYLVGATMPKRKWEMADG